MKSKQVIFSDGRKLARLLHRLRASGKTIVFTNGCFDVIHRGHVTYLAKAKKLGDVLVVGLNTDKSVRSLKGAGRPFNRQKDRAYILSQLKPVDYVCLFDEKTPARLIELLRPHILVKGGDYRIQDVVGAKTVIKNGGKVVIIPYVSGYSTTRFVEKLMQTR